MRLRTTLIFLFIFIAWYVIYQAFFSFIINISFVLSIATIIWVIRKIKGIKNMFKKKETEKNIFLRKVRT